MSWLVLVTLIGRGMAADEAARHLGWAIKSEADSTPTDVDRVEGLTPDNERLELLTLLFDEEIGRGSLLGVYLPEDGGLVAADDDPREPYGLPWDVKVGRGMRLGVVPLFGAAMTDDEGDVSRVVVSTVVPLLGRSIETPLDMDIESLGW